MADNNQWINSTSLWTAFLTWLLITFWWGFAPVWCTLLMKMMTAFVKYIKYTNLSSLSVLLAIFPGEPGLASFIGAKDDGGGDDNWNYKTCTAPVRSSPPTNQHPVFLQAGCPSCHPTNSVKVLKGKISHSTDLFTPSSPGVFHLCLWLVKAPGYLGGSLPCLSSALWRQYTQHQIHQWCPKITITQLAHSDVSIHNVHNYIYEFHESFFSFGLKMLIIYVTQTFVFHHQLTLNQFFQWLWVSLLLQWPDKKSANRIAIHIGRCIGALSIGEAVTSLQAPGFLHIQDKKALFVTRIMVSSNRFTRSAAVAFWLLLGVLAWEGWREAWRPSHQGGSRSL